MRVHRYWHGPNRPLELPGATEWSDRSLPAEVVAWLDAATERVYAQDLLRHRANMARLWILHEHGGMWLDHDVRLYADVSDWPLPFAAAHGTLCSCVLAFPAGHPMLAAAMRAIDEGTGRGQSIDVSGEALLERLRTPDVELHQLPHDRAGDPLPDGTPWAVHLYRGGRA